MSLVVMGIDPGSQVTGYGVITMANRDSVQFIAAGVVRASRQASFFERIKHIYDEMTVLMDSHQPDEVALEDIFYARNIRSSLQLGQARGAAILAALNAGKPVSAYAPRDIKMALTGNGAAAKEQVQYMVEQILNCSMSGFPLDASDALAIALCHGFRK